MLIEDVDLLRVVKKNEQKSFAKKKVPIKTWPLPETTLVEGNGEVMSVKLCSWKLVEPRLTGKSLTGIGRDC